MIIIILFLLDKYIINYIFNFNNLFLFLIMAEEVDANQEQFKKLHCRMYEDKFPKEHELVYVSKCL